MSRFEVISSDTVWNWRDLQSWEQKLMVALLPCARNRVKKLELAPWQKNMDQSLWLLRLWGNSKGSYKLHSYRITNYKPSVSDLESLKRVEMLKYGQSCRQTQVCDTFSLMNSYSWQPNVPARATWVNWFSVEGGSVWCLQSKFDFRIHVECYGTNMYAFQFFSFTWTPFQKREVGVLKLSNPKNTKIKRDVLETHRMCIYEIIQNLLQISGFFPRFFPEIFRWPNLHGDEDSFLGIAWSWSLGCRHPLPKRWQTWLRFGRLDWPWWTQGTKSFHVLDLAVPLDAGEECFRNVPSKFVCSSCRCVSGHKV